MNYLHIGNKAPKYEGKLPKSHRKSHVKLTHFCREPQEVAKKRTACKTASKPKKENFYLLYMHQTPNSQGSVLIG